MKPLIKNRVGRVGLGASVGALLLAASTASHGAGIVVLPQDIEENGTHNGLLFDNGVMRVSEEVSTFPIIWVANAGEASVSKIDTNTGVELARYWTFFPEQASSSPWGGPAPSRTAVDSRGNVYVANRHFDGRPPAVLKILNEEAVDHAGDGQVNTSRNEDGEGMIDPDTEMMPLEDTNNTGRVDPEDLQDDRIAWHVTVGNDNDLGRSLCIDNDGQIWLGMYRGQAYYQLDSDTGQVLQGPIDTEGHTPYGCLVDGDGMLWSAALGSDLGQLNTNTGEWVARHSHSGFGSNYGIAVSDDYVFLGVNPFIRFNKATEEFDDPSDDNMSVLGIAYGPDGNVVVGDSSAGGVAKYTPDGDLIWESPAQEDTGHVRGVVLDANGDVWAIHVNHDRLSKYRGEDGEPLGVFLSGAGPYTYSDATGLGTRGLGRRTGIGRIIVDGHVREVLGAAGGGTVAAAQVGGTQEEDIPEYVWADSCVSITESPENAESTYRIRAADSLEALEAAPFQVFTPGEPLPDGVEGRYVQIEVEMRANDDDESEVFQGLAVTTDESDCNTVLAQALDGVVDDPDDEEHERTRRGSACSVTGTGAAGPADPTLPLLAVLALLGALVGRRRRAD
ncbi:JDVT-CTERM domain-containing protein [Alkalilimnicola ehrlichii MLHE-1]|uniref:Uncharacterized protein n=1 Tax=Alkalilimnicola ehrlichii (strain ATCC BAA-1101 / DSM 17681 / MLHE-1) TaxID=187272 RepID=Q0A601_ALKEH|nr:JDVT-CTERM domain-containing protein [Alkalilimnicola ehrlichii]ABI57736.1 hypothetical protein Mlg_2396 [Alkalilimnicola ehrlichii MLHE-1]